MSSKNERKKGLGRGLSSFLDVDSFNDIVERKKDEDKGKGLSNNSSYLPIEHLVPNLDQPRKDFSTDELNSLASSIADTRMGCIIPEIGRASCRERV